MKSSSVHRLNADKGLSKWGRRLWHSLNWLNNSILPNWKSQHLQIKKFSPDLSTKYWNQVAAKSSPSRALSDLFWMQLPWGRIRSALGEIHVLDTGCGSGRYGVELQAFSREQMASYVGLDESPHDDWPTVMQEHPFIRLERADSASFFGLIPKETNLFISQSAIEHFPEDLTYFRQLRDFIRDHRRPTLQVHLFPSAACLKLYHYHGVRQYTPRTVSLIIKFYPESVCTLFALGGASSNQLHWEWITKPVLTEAKGDRRNTEPEEYRAQLLQSIQKNEVSSASFYALVIASNLETNLWD